jgi:hypothetical protein
VSEVMRPPSYDDRRSFSAFHGLADDREMILRSADRGAQRSGVMAADRHIPACERRIDGIKALQLRWISLRERGRINAEAFFHGDGVRKRARMV